MESDIRFYRRRASEELAAAGRSVTQSARERRLALAGIFLARLKALEGHGSAELLTASEGQAFKWASGRAANQG